MIAFTTCSGKPISKPGSHGHVRRAMEDEVLFHAFDKVTRLDGLVDTLSKE
jgi:hypothetical protein